MKTKYKPMDLRKEIEISKRHPRYIIKEYLLKGRKLVCIGVHHTSNLNHPQFKVIKNVFKKRDFSTIVLEISKEQLEYYKKIDKKYLFKEKDFVIKLANEKKIPIIAGDKGLKKILLENVDKYGKRSALLLRVLIYLKNKKNLLEEVDKIIDYLDSKDKFKEMFREFKKREGINNGDFRKMIEDFILKNNNKKVNEITSEDNILPSPVENKTKLNKIMGDISYKRDKYMINQIRNNLKKGDILFIAGKNHVIRQEPYLKKLEKIHKN